MILPLRRCFRFYDMLHTACPYFQKVSFLELLLTDSFASGKLAPALLRHMLKGSTAGMMGGLRTNF